MASNVLTHDLLRNRTAKQRQGVAYTVLVASAAVGVAGVAAAWDGNALAFALVPTAVILALVTLRIAGPQDARSFRLYRPAKTKPHTVHPDVEAIDLAAE